MRIPSSLLLAMLLLPAAAAFGATSGPSATALDQEYAQVRKIALKDPRVQAAFQKANQRLNDKILEIDPALKPIVEGAHLQSFQAAPPTHGRRAVVHVVAAGETPGSVAAQYHVPVAALEKANHITDAHKLRVGQKLVIPPL